MSFRQSVKKVTPKVDFQSYNVLVAGGYKSGKTRMWKELIEKFYPDNPEAGLLIAFEAGYNTWELDSVVPMHNYDWNFFKNEVVKGLLQEAKEGRITKVIGIDTVDKLMEKASEFILDKLNKKYGKKFEGLQEITENIKGENGYIMLKQEVWSQISLLKNAGYGFIWLAWTKEKETTTVDGLKYNSIELKMSKTGADIFESEADLTCCLYNEVKVISKDGEELEKNAVSKTNKEIASKFHTTETYMYFRPSNYIGIAGGRFTELPEKVPYSADNFLKVFEEAVKGQLNKTKKTVAELKVVESEVRDNKAKETVEQEQSKDSIEDIIAKIQEKVAGLAVKEKMALALQFEKAVGVRDFTKLTDVDKLQKVLEICK